MLTTATPEKQYAALFQDFQSSLKVIINTIVLFFNVNINQSRSELWNNLSDVLSLALIYRRAITQNYQQDQKKQFYVKDKKKSVEGSIFIRP